MRSEDLKMRTKNFVLNVMKLVSVFPHTREADIIGRQLLKAGTSVGANYRSACRAQSRAHFISKIHIVLEEADESQYWLELVCERNLAPQVRVRQLVREADELTAIFSQSIRTARKST